MLYSNYSITGVQNVLYIIILHLPYTVSVVINLLDTECKNLHNVTVLYYYCHSYAKTSVQGYSTGNSRLNIKNIKVYNNTGNSVTDLLVVKVFNCYLTVLRGRTISFSKSYFYSNINIRSIITFVIISPCLTRYPAIIQIIKCDISYNHAANISVNEQQNQQSQWSAFFTIMELNISYNMHTDGMGLILFNTAYVKFSNVKITSNGYYRNIIKFYLSTFKVQHSLAISSNCVRNVLSTTAGLCTVLYPNEVITVTNNIVYSFQL